MVYGQILKKSWKTIWQNKFLWVFGIFVALLLGNENEYNVLFNSVYKINKGSILKIVGVFKSLNLKLLTQDLSRLFESGPLSFILISLLFLFILILAIWLTTVSKGALIGCFDKIDKREKTGLKDGISSGIKNFWPVLGISALSKIISYSLFGIIIIPLFAAFSKISSPTANIILTLGAIVLFLPVFIVISFIARYSLYYAVLKEKRIWDSINSSIRLFKDNWVVSLEMAFILFFINIIAGLLIAIMIFMTTAPFILLGSISYYSAFSFGFWVTLAVGILIISLLFILGKAILSVFQFNAWFILFRELTNKKERIISKISRFLSRIFNK